MHFRTGCGGGHSHDTIQLSKTAENKLSGLTQKYIRELFDEYDVSPKLREELMTFYYTQLVKGLKVGYSPKVEHYDAAIAKSLQKNIAEFSAFKETSFKKSLHEMLTEGDKLMPWSEFKKKAETVADNYNKKWLKTEYDHTVANANMTAQWAKFEAQKEVYPNLHFHTVGDSAVREEHAALDNFIAPVDDESWSDLTPPLDWGCRCYITQTDEKATEETPDFQPKKQFANNPAKSGEIFKKGMPYSDHLNKADIAEATEFAKELL